MGFRAHIRTTSKVVLDKQGYFNNEIQDLASLLDQLISKYNYDFLIYDTYGNIAHVWELSVSDLKRTIEYIEKNFSEREYVFNDWTKSEVIVIFNKWLELNRQNEDALDDKDIIILEWV